MTLSIHLETENGKTLDSFDDHGLLMPLIPPLNDKNYYCIKYINPYGDTVFNYLQMDDFISELKQIKSNSSDEKVKELIDKIIQLAERCKQKVHTYIKFYGD
jgi:hypothetical protein